MGGKSNIILYVWPLLYGTLLAAVLAMLIATPLAFGVALVISHYAPRRLAKPLGYLIDLLAAVPSVVYGLWGIAFLGPRILPFYQWLEDNLGFLPFFEGPATSGRTILTASHRARRHGAADHHRDHPRDLLPDADAPPGGRPGPRRDPLGDDPDDGLPLQPLGHDLATMLGLGRALGETMAVAMVLSATGVITLNLISTTNPSTIAANIALQFGEASGTKINVLIFSGLVLFVITFAVNFLARAIVARSNVEGRRHDDTHRRPHPDPARTGPRRPPADPQDAPAPLATWSSPARRRPSPCWPR